MLLLAGYANAQNELTPKCETPTKNRDACWLKIANHNNCYVWNSKAWPNLSITWSGQCKAGVADGQGGEVWQSDWGERTDIGTYANGKRHGQWVQEDEDGDVWEGPYVNGKRHGEWAFRNSHIKEWGTSPYVYDKMHGLWEWKYPSGLVVTGRYVDGEEHGQWVRRYTDGRIKCQNYSHGDKVGDKFDC